MGLASVSPITVLSWQIRPADLKAKFVLGETQKELLALQTRLHECLKIIISTTTATKALKTKVVKKAVAAKRLQNRSDLFDKYDKDKDGAFDRKELSAYSSGEFNFSLSSEALDRIFAQFANGDAKIPKAKFQGVKMAIGIAREEAASKVRRAAAEARRKVVEAKKEELQKEFDKAGEGMDDIEPEVKKAEEKVAPLTVAVTAPESSEEKAKVTDAAVDSVADQVKAVRQEIELVKRQFAKLSEDVEQELKSYVTLETRKLELRAAAFEQRMIQVDASLTQARDYLARQEVIEMEKLRADAAKAMKNHAAEQKLSPEAFYALADADHDGSISKGDFISLFNKMTGHDLPVEKLQLLFDKLEESGNGLMPKESFLRLIRVHYYVAKETVMTTEMAIKASETVRRLEEGEVIEVHEGPIKDDNLGVKRVRGRAVKDGSIGWATVVGNNGGVFLEEGGSTFKVVSGTAMTSELDPTAGEQVRMLKEGEILDVLEWDKEIASVVRMKVKVKGDTASGWVTKSTLDGVVFLKIA